MSKGGTSIPAEVEFRKYHAAPDDEFVGLLREMLPHRLNALMAAAMAIGRVSPFLEVGAEFCLNGMLLAGSMQADGFCADVSFDALKSADDYAKRLGLGAVPSRVQANAHRLPFPNRSFPFVLFWGSLHHFDDPRRAMLEAWRVLAPDGFLYFDEEPIKRRLVLPLFATGVVPYELSRLEKLLLDAGILPFIARIGAKAELKRGIREVKFSMREFYGLFERFDLVRLEFRPVLTGGIPSAPGWGRRLAERFAVERERFLTEWFGGEVAGLAVPRKRAARTSGGTLLVARHPSHDRIGLDSRPRPDGVRIMGRDVRAVSDDGGFVWFEIPDDLRNIGWLSVELGDGEIELDRVALDSSHARGVFFQYSFYGNPAALACPDCVYVRSFCEWSRCNRNCATVCARGAISFADGIRIDADACDGCGDCIFACPFEAIDRPVLKRTDSGLACEVCGKIFEVRDGIAVALDADTRKLLGMG